MYTGDFHSIFSEPVFAENLFFHGEILCMDHKIRVSKEEIENPKKEKGQSFSLSLSLSLSFDTHFLVKSTTSTQLRPLNTSTLHQKRRCKNFSSIFLNHLEEYMM